MAHAAAGEKPTLPELSPDAVAHCADFMDISDVVNLAMTCKSLRASIYSDYIWSRLYNERWSNQQLTCGASDIRELYINRLTAIKQMKFSDPKSVSLVSDPSVIYNHIIMDNSNIWASQGSDVDWYTLKYNSSSEVTAVAERIKSHGARITNMRLIPIFETWLSRNSETKSRKNVLITSSTDRTIRLWYKGKSQRCFKGHNGPVTALADKLVGYSDKSKLLASGGEDCTVKIWSLGSNYKNHALATYHGHEKALSFLSVASHKPSLLISVSIDSKLRVWDTCSSNASPCVGSTSISGTKSNIVGIKCHDTNCHIATRSFITSIDLRTMQKAFYVPVRDSEIFSFEILPSKWMICAGGEDKALLWDIRKLPQKSTPIAELESNTIVTLLHMDPYKIITAGPDDNYVNIFDPANGNLVNKLDCGPKAESESVTGVNSMAVYGSKIVTAGFVSGELLFREFSNCSKMVYFENENENEGGSSKFWDIETQD